ncbi:MAG: FKBP-type peptidyl-prolyl cis-trans isomerase [Phycisphaerales bacterium]|nr:FKBP-type peptidyl-prolyl cis-trans isomerase [Phycisphaerales bacterium]
MNTNSQNPRLPWLLAAAASASMGLTSLADDPKPAGQPAAPEVAPKPPEEPEVKRAPLAPITWSESEIERISKLLIGSWKSTVTVAAGTKDEEKVDISLSIARVRSVDVPDLLYAESARVDSLQAPYRQAFYQIYRFKDGYRLRTYELASQLGGAMVGWWTNPDLFPPVSRRDLIATIDIDLKIDGDSVTGKTPYPFPTGRGGAVEMTSEVEFGTNKFITADRGFDEKGNIVWGVQATDKQSFARFEPPVKTWTADGNVFVIEYRRGNDQLVCQNSDAITVHYLGFLNNGFRFDSSLDRTPPNPLSFYVNTQQVIPGFVQALLGANTGTVRRVYIPWEQAYGKYGNIRNRIPPYSDLYFDFEVMRLRRPDPAEIKDKSFPVTIKDNPRAQEILQPIGPDGKPIPKDTPPAQPK